MARRIECTLERMEFCLRYGIYTGPHGHGTHVAGTIAQRTNNGKGRWCRTWNDDFTREGIEDSGKGNSWGSAGDSLCCGPRCDVVNMSLGAGDTAITM